MKHWQAPKLVRKESGSGRQSTLKLKPRPGECAACDRPPKAAQSLRLRLGQRRLVAAASGTCK